MYLLPVFPEFTVVQVDPLKDSVVVTPRGLPKNPKAAVSSPAPPKPILPVFYPFIPLYSVLFLA